MKPKLVKIEWIDIVDESGPWVSRDALPTPATIHSVGWLIHEAIEYVVITNSIPDDDADTEVGTATAIPRAAIQDMTELLDV